LITWLLEEEEVAEQDAILEVEVLVDLEQAQVYLLPQVQHIP
jgi:hypothetical protein